MRLLQSGIIDRNQVIQSLAEPRAFQTNGVDESVTIGALFSGTVGVVTPAFSMGLRVVATTFTDSILGSTTNPAVRYYTQNSTSSWTARVARGSTAGGGASRRLQTGLNLTAGTHLASTWAGTSGSFPITYANAIHTSFATGTNGNSAANFSEPLTFALSGGIYTPLIAHLFWFVPSIVLSGAEVTTLTGLLNAYSASTGAGVAVAEAAVVAFLTGINSSAIFCPVDSNDDLTTSIRDACGNNNLIPINMTSSNLVAVP